MESAYLRTCVRACVRTCVSVVCSRLPFQHGGIHCVADTKPRYNIIHLIKIKDNSFIYKRILDTFSLHD